MEFHLGRLLDHVHLRVTDLAASRRFYAAALGALGRELVDLAPGLVNADELVLSAAEDPSRVSRVHIAFQTSGPEQVRAFHAAGLAAGGRDNGAPGERPHYHPGYYAAFLLDPDGNNVEAVYHGPHTRSAPSVVLTPT